MSIGARLPMGYGHHSLPSVIQSFNKHPPSAHHGPQGLAQSVSSGSLFHRGKPEVWRAEATSPRHIVREPPGGGLPPKVLPFPSPFTQLLPVTQNGVLQALCRHTMPGPCQSVGFSGVPLQGSLPPPRSGLVFCSFIPLSTKDSMSTCSVPGLLLGDRGEQETTDW